MENLLEETVFPSLWKRMDRSRKAKERQEEEIVLETTWLENTTVFRTPDTGEVEEDCKLEHWGEPARWKGVDEIEKLRIKIENWNIWYQVKEKVGKKIPMRFAQRKAGKGNLGIKEKFSTLGKRGKTMKGKVGWPDLLR